ncbi:MAG: DUF1800 domain-containing protein [Planctomycetota bacterium]
MNLDHLSEAHGTRFGRARGFTIQTMLLLPLLFVVLFSSGFAPNTDDGKTDDATTDTVIGIEGAAHLFGRTTFGAPLQQLQQFAPLNRNEAVEKLLATLATQSVTPLPKWAPMLPLDVIEQRGKTEESRKAFQRESRRWQAELRTWWARELISSPSPLTERLVLMWHGHFTSEMRKVRSAQAMLRQNQMFRRLGSGDFRILLHEVALDPAMAIYLDTRRSTRMKPNENFARELLELYGLGEGNYTEDDIKEAARAFTGYRIDTRTGSLRKVPRRHDPGEKSVLGSTGRLGAKEVVDAVLAQSACPRWISRRFWIEFVSPTPDDTVIEKWAQALVKNDWQLKSLLRTVLISDAFWAQENRGSLVKSPVDLVIGTIRSLQLEQAPAGQALRIIGRLGQQLFDPPNVAGWPGGEQWIDATTLLGRRRFLSTELQEISILSMMKFDPGSVTDRATPAPQEPEMDPEMDPEMAPEMVMAREMPKRVNRRDRRRHLPAVVRKYQQLWNHLGDDAMARMSQLQAWLLPLEPVGEISDSPAIQARLGSILLDPTYQLK